MLALKEGHDFLLGGGLVSESGIQSLLFAVNGEAAGFYELFCVLSVG